MSVAFRRESDEEHKEPRFELPLPAGPNLVTARGLTQIERRVAELEAKALIETNEMQLEEVRRDLRYWQTRLVTAQIAPAPSAGQAAFGSRVRYTQDGKARAIDIVGSDEAEPAEGRIAFTAPLARALIGAGVGDVVEFGPRNSALEIKAIEPIPE